MPKADFTATLDSSWMKYNFQNLSQQYKSVTWNFGDGTPNASAPSHIYASAGNYTVKLFAFDACGNVDSISKTISVTAPSSIGKTQEIESVRVFPNPSKNGLITIMVNSQKVGSKFSIVNILGAEILRGNCAREETQFDISTLPSGLYFLQLNGKIFKVDLQK
ncbi:MAG: PKD domain-containing protein [Chitinophagales bacterium]|nr:PKD domain-containing protein [Chitinophagales bacterium]